ncbi:MAG: TAXI family TRAP transporter solute-binding subunit [Egibacteraceae bacterium]
MRIVLLALTVFLASCTSSPGSSGAGGGPQRLSIATGGTSGVYFVYGGGIADTITRHLPGYEATAEVTSASVDNLLLIADQGTDIAFSLADTAVDAVNGEGAFGEPVPAQALANLYVNYTQVATTRDRGITTVDQLRGRRVSVGSPNSGTEVIALRILEAAGIDPDQDIQRAQLGVGESVQALRDGAIDAFFWSGGLPTGGITDLASTSEMVLLQTAAYLDTLQRGYGEIYLASAIPAGTYQGVDRDIPTIGVPNYLMVHESMDDELAYQLTKLLFDHRDQLARVHPEAANLDLVTAPQVTEPVQLHPGARRYYEETRDTARGSPGGAVVVTGNTGDGGQQLASAALPTSGAFAVRYQHSVYDASAIESFVASGDGSFAMVAVASPSAAVLDYYGLDGRRWSSGGWAHLQVAVPDRLRRLPLIGTPKGQRTLEVSGRRLPLGDMGHVELSVLT